MSLLRQSLLALALTTVSLLSQAAPTFFNFNGAIDAGPLSGQSFSGQYSFDPAAVTGADFESIVLDSFALSFLGQSFAGNASASADFSFGVFLGLSYNQADPSQSLTLTSGTVDVSDAFLHYTPTGGVESSGGYAVSAVPEPAAIWMALAGLVVLRTQMRRRRTN